MKTALAIAAALLLSSTATFAQAQETTQTPTPPAAESPQSPASPAQLKREHDRAIAAGDHANDPFNPASSNALNQQQLAKAKSLGNGPVATTSPPDAQNMPVMAPPPTEPAPATQPVQPAQPTGT